MKLNSRHKPLIVETSDLSFQLIFMSRKSRVDPIFKKLSSKCIFRKEKRLENSLNDELTSNAYLGLSSALKYELLMRDEN